MVKTCSSCSTEAKKDSLKIYSDGWSCPKCSYFNECKEVDTTNDSSEERYPELVRMSSLILIILLFKLITPLPWSIIGSFIGLTLLFGMIEHIYVTYMLPEEKVDEYRVKRKKQIRQNISEFVSLCITGVFIIGVLVLIIKL